MKTDYSSTTAVYLVHYSPLSDEKSHRHGLCIGTQKQRENITPRKKMAYDVR